MCMCVYIHIHIHTDIHTYIYIYIYVYICPSERMCGFFLHQCSMCRVEEFVGMSGCVW